MQNTTIDQQQNESLKKNPLFFYVRQHRRAFFTGLFFLLCTNALDAFYPILLKNVIDQISAKAELNLIYVSCAWFFGLYVALAASRFCWRVFFGRYHTLAAEDLRNRIFAHFTKMGPNFFHKNPVGELMSLITNDVQSFRGGIGSGVLLIVDAISLLVFILPAMIHLNPEWTWKTLIFVPFVPFFIRKVMDLIFHSYKIQQDKLSEISGITQEIIAGIRVIKGFVQEKTRLNLYNKKSRELELATNKVVSADSLFDPVMEIAVASGTVTLLWIAGQDVMSGAVSVGTLVAFQRYISKMVWPMTAVGAGLSHYKKGMASFLRIREVLDQQSDIPDLGSKEITRFDSLSVKNLSYTYPGSSTPALQNVNFEVRAGETFGIVGPVGSGKTTLLYLLNRLYPAPPQSIHINELALEDITQRSLHSQLVLVPQEPFLFSESIGQNISFSTDENEERLSEAQDWARIVDIDEEIKSLPHQFNSELGERGVNLSGGQKQRLTIARGLMTRAPVVMLDDSLSAVDTKTEKSIQQRLAQASTAAQKRTQIIVAHRLSTLQHADRILVLNEGQVEALGTHQELLEFSKTYRELVRLQESTT